MRILLDTCTFIWLCAEPDRLSSSARAALDDPGNALLLSDVSTLEITLKWTAGKLALPEPPRLWMEAQILTWSIEQVDLRREHMYRASELPGYHKDPFDRLLIATALTSGATIVTPDTAIHAYPVSWTW